MRTTFTVILAAALAAACTRPNPAVCCDTAEQCTSLGVTDPRPCSVGQACLDFECVASQCTTSADCDDPAAPVCRDRLCVEACRNDTECTGVASGPYCAADGQCIACRSNDDCASATPICDNSARACRGCERDADCSSGVCLEAPGVCADTSSVLHVAASGVDAGGCSMSAPCATIPYALALTTMTRNVIRLQGGSLPIPSPVVLDRNVTIDGTSTELYRPVGGPTFTISMQAAVTLEGVTLLSRTTEHDVIAVASSSSLNMSDVTMHNSLIQIDGGAVNMSRTSSDGVVTVVSCSNGAFTLSHSDLSNTPINADNCVVDLYQNLVSGSGRLMDVRGGTAHVTNNLFVQSYELSDSVTVANVTPGSEFNFNTIVNTSTVRDSGVALYCDPSVSVEGNVFAYNSTEPLGLYCVANHSVFDPPGAVDAATGTGNVTAAASTIFKDFPAGIYDLAVGSPAIGLSPPSSVSVDVLGRSRPRPSGSMSDAGAYEAP